MFTHHLYTFCHSAHDFSALISRSYYIEKNRNSLTTETISRFINSLPLVFESFQKNKVFIDPSDWEKFDHSFSAILSDRPSSDSLLNIVSHIEKLSVRRFQKMSPKFIPIQLLGPEAKVETIALEKLKSTMFRGLFSCGMKETQERQIILDTLSSGCFDHYIAFLKNRPFEIAPNQFHEIFSLSHMLGDARLFNEAFSQFLIHLKRHGNPFHTGDLGKPFLFLCTLFGLKRKNQRNTSFDPVQRAKNLKKSESSQSTISACNLSYAQFWQKATAAKKAPPSSKIFISAESVIESTLEQFYSVMMPMEEGEKNRFFSLLRIFGECFEAGVSIREDPAAAVTLYSFGAHHNDPGSQTQLAQCYAKGFGVEKNEVAAFRMYKLAADQGYGAAQNALGFYYAQGITVQQDLKKAVSFFSLAAAQGNATAQNNLGIMYEEGLGVTKDIQQAVHFFSLAAAQGNAHARSYLTKLGLYSDRS